MQPDWWRRRRGRTQAKVTDSKVNVATLVRARQVATARRAKRMATPPVLSLDYQLADGHQQGRLGVDYETPLDWLLAKETVRERLSHA